MKNQTLIVEIFVWHINIQIFRSLCLLLVDFTLSVLANWKWNLFLS